MSDEEDQSDQERETDDEGGDDFKQSLSHSIQKLGAKKIMQGVVALLLSDYLFAIVLPLMYPGRYNTIPMILCHALFAVFLGYRASRLNTDQQPQIVSFYGFIWLLFYGEFFVFLLI